MTPTLLLIIKYRYAILLPLAIFQGSLFALLVGFLIHLGYLNFLPAYGILILGDIIPDTSLYLLGRLGNQKKLVEKYSPRFRIGSGNFPLVEKLWRDHPKKTMFFGKMAAGISTPILISAGLVKMSYRRFIGISLSCTLLLYAIFLTLGYYLGSTYVIAATYIRGGSILLAVILIAIAAFFIWMNSYAKKQLTRLDKNEK